MAMVSAEVMVMIGMVLLVMTVTAMIVLVGVVLMASMVVLVVKEHVVVVVIVMAMIVLGMVNKKLKFRMLLKVPKILNICPYVSGLCPSSVECSL